MMGEGAADGFAFGPDGGEQAHVHQCGAAGGVIGSAHMVDAERVHSQNDRRLLDTAEVFENATDEHRQVRRREGLNRPAVQNDGGNNIILAFRREQHHLPADGVEVLPSDFGRRVDDAGIRIAEALLGCKGDGYVNAELFFHSCLLPF